MQEAITDQVRAIEFDMESIESAEVGSLMDALEDSGFERIADDEEAEIAPKPKKKRGRPRKKKTDEPKEDSKPKEEKRKKKASFHVFN